MAKTIINLMSEDEVYQLRIQQMIQSGTMTSEVYAALNPQDQTLVRQELFNLHAKPIAPPVALSALEFTIFGMAKIFFKIQSGGVLTDTETAFMSRFQQYVNEHEITMDPADWRVAYAEQGMLVAKKNRADYLQKKIDITGSR